MSEVSIDREKALRVGCRIWQQFDKISEKEAQDLSHGQNVEALRVALNRLRNLFDKEFDKELERLVVEGRNEANKPA